jgi:glycosyltransferase involved in cell wall biosynthesis
VTRGWRGSQDRVVVIGSGWRFASGISHYTYRLSCALADNYPVGALLMRRLIPRHLYPGRERVGAQELSSAYPVHIPVYDGVDWYWGRSLARALQWLDRQRPTVVVLEWWSGAVLHTYLRLARYAVRRGARVILEWHEAQDTGESAVPGARRYVQTLMPRLLSAVDAHVVHSEFDMRAIKAAFTLGDAPVRVIPHGPYDHLPGLAAPRESQFAWHDPQAAPGTESSPFRLLYFGVVRPFKGVEDLVTAFSGLDRDQAIRFRLCIVGETWESWTAPAEAIARSPHSDLIERVDRYVTDAEVAAFFGQSDAVVLPYHRSSASGPLAIAMSAGLPVITTSVGGLVEAVQGYPGVILVPPRDPAALQQALSQLLERRGQRYPDPHSWTRTTAEYQALIDELNRTGRGSDGKTRAALTLGGGVGIARSSQQRSLVQERIRPLARTSYYAARGVRAQVLARAWWRSPLHDPESIFIVGCGRSGTTLLGDLLDKHPTVRYRYEPYASWAAIGPVTDCLQLYSRGEHHCLLDASAVTPTTRERFRRLMSPASGFTLVEKSPINALRLGYLDAITPTARFVHIVRDGTDVARSIQQKAAVNRRMAFRPALNDWWGVGDVKWSALRRDGVAVGYYSHEVGQLTTDAQRGAYEWLLSLREVDAWRERLGSRLVELRYVDLIDEPRTTIAALADSLGLSCPADWLTQVTALVRRPATRKPSEPLILPRQMCADFNSFQARFGFAGRAIAREHPRLASHADGPS